MKRVDFSDEELSRCAALVAEAMLDALPEPEDCRHEFSPAFEAKMEKLIAKVRRREAWRRLARSAAAVFLAALLGSGLFLSFNAEARAEFFSWVRELYESSIVYRFFEKYDTEATLPDVTFGWLPEGYAEAVSDGDETMRIFVFESEDPDLKPFLFEYYFTHSGMHSALRFNDTYTTKAVSVNDFSAELYLSASGADSNELIWIDEDFGIMYSLSAFLEESVMLHIAESIILTE